MAQGVKSSRGGIPVVFAVSSDLDQLIDDMRRRRLIGISDSKVDDVLATVASIELQGLNLGEHIRRKSF